MNRTELARKAKTTASQMLQAKGYLSMVDVLMAMGTLTKENYERWRFRQLPHLEKVLPGSLNKFQFLLRTLRSHACDELRLTPSPTVYTSLGKGHRQPLRFSKYGNSYVEELYSTHYVSRRLKQAKPKPPGATLGPEQDLESRLASSPRLS
jgi:hypothetical protein